MKLVLVTKDFEVSDANLVQVRLGARDGDPIVTLQYLTTELAVKTAQFQKLEAELSELTSLITKASGMVTEVKLIEKKEEVPV